MPSLTTPSILLTSSLDHVPLNKTFVELVPNLLVTIPPRVKEPVPSLPTKCLSLSNIKLNSSPLNGSESKLVSNNPQHTPLLEERVSLSSFTLDKKMFTTNTKVNLVQQQELSLMLLKSSSLTILSCCSGDCTNLKQAQMHGVVQLVFTRNLPPLVTTSLTFTTKLQLDLPPRNHCQVLDLPPLLILFWLEPPLPEPLFLLDLLIPM